MRVKSFASFVYERVRTESTRLHDLSAYFERDVEEIIAELPEFYSEYHRIFEDWISEKDLGDDAPSDWRGLDGDMLAEYCDYLHGLSNDPARIREYRVRRLPLYVTYTYEGEVNDSWIVHFTDSPRTVSEILRTGIMGVRNMEDLAATAQNEEGLARDGYCFGYEVGDAYYNFRDGLKYGECGVLLRASGVKLYHNGDDELQTIFIGAEASGLVGFTRDGKTFRTLDGAVRSEDFDEFVEMVTGG